MNSRIVIILLIVVILGVGAYIMRPHSANAPTGSTNTSVLTNENAGTDVTGLTGDLLALAKAQDNRRLQDMQSIQGALTAYKGDHGSYPTTLAALSPAYLASVPKDPKTSADYTYTSSGASYQLTYTLQVGVQGYGAGEHTLAPEPGTLPD